MSKRLLQTADKEYKRIIGRLVIEKGFYSWNITRNVCKLCVICLNVCLAQKKLLLSTWHACFMDHVDGEGADMNVLIRNPLIKMSISEVA